MRFLLFLELEFFLMFDAKMFTEEWIDNYRKHHPDRELVMSAWWKVPGGPDYTQLAGTGD